MTESQAAIEIYRYFYGRMHPQSFHQATYDFILETIGKVDHRELNVWEVGSPVHEP